MDEAGADGISRTIADFATGGIGGFTVCRAMGSGVADTEAALTGGASGLEADDEGASAAELAGSGGGGRLVDDGAPVDAVGLSFTRSFWATHHASEPHAARAAPTRVARSAKERGRRCVTGSGRGMVCTP